MPTEQKIEQVEDIRDRLSRASIIVTTGYESLTSSDMNALRKSLREQGIENESQLNHPGQQGIQEVEYQALKHI